MNRPEPASPEMRRRQRRTLLLIAALFFAPVVAAFYFYYGSGWRPEGTVNHGVLVSPPRALPQVALAGADGKDTSADFLRGKWSLVYLGAGACDDECRKALYVMRQVRLSLNQNMDRVQRVFLYSGGCCEQPFFATEHAGLIEASTDSEAGRRLEGVFTTAAAASGAAAARGRIYVVDPLGNLMLSYPDNSDPEGMLDDLKRLLKLSHVG